MAQPSTQLLIDFVSKPLGGFASIPLPPNAWPFFKVVQTHAVRVLLKLDELLDTSLPPLLVN